MGAGGHEVGHRDPRVLPGHERLPDQDGIGAACNPLRVFDVAVANAGASWRVFGRYLLGALIGIAIGLLVPFGAVLVMPAAVLMAVPYLATIYVSLREPLAEPPPDSYTSKW